MNLTESRLRVHIGQSQLLTVVAMAMVGRNA
jgi:hypothetical protein